MELMGCLAKERIGDNIIDCLGASDERIAIKNSCFGHSTERFKCLHRGCASPFELCDGFHNCNSNDDDELVCPWLFNSTCNIYYEFSCKNGRCISRQEQQCNNIIDCQPDGEDQWFCGLIYSKIDQFSLNNIKEYPLIIINSSQSKIITDNFHSTKKILFKSVINPLDDWYCNHGIIVRNRFSGIICLCPPSYYSLRCQYQSERVLITVRIDTPIILSKYQNKETIIRLVAYLIFEDAIVLFELSSTTTKKNVEIGRFVSMHFLITMSNVDLKASWLFDVPFSFLPVNRLVLHLILNDQEMCNIRNCVHGNCRKYLNFPHDEYCQCEQNWSGKRCNITRICPCVGDGKCIDRYPTPICVCPLGLIGNQCRVFFNSCTRIKCQNDGICQSLDERQSMKFICLCQNGYHGTFCERMNNQI